VLTINSNLTLASGSTTIMAGSHNNQNNDQVVSSGVSFDGMLAVTTNAGDGPLVAGDTFQLFNSGTHGGSGFRAAVREPKYGDNFYLTKSKLIARLSSWQLDKLKTGNDHNDIFLFYETDPRSQLNPSNHQSALPVRRVMPASRCRQ
jgi:hypothetical protein